MFLLPFFQLYSSIGLFDTPLAVALAHCLFTVPLSVWILEGFMSGVPTEIDDMARIDGHSFWFFHTDFLAHQSQCHRCDGIFCFMFSWVELLLARTLTGSEAKPIVVVMTRTVSASGMDWGYCGCRDIYRFAGYFSGLVCASALGEGLCSGPCVA